MLFDRGIITTHTTKQFSRKKKKKKKKERNERKKELSWELLNYCGEMNMPRTRKREKKKEGSGPLYGLFVLRQ